MKAPIDMLKAPINGPAGAVILSLRLMAIGAPMNLAIGPVMTRTWPQLNRSWDRERRRK